jgi:hypothetical protein
MTENQMIVLALAGVTALVVGIVRVTRHLSAKRRMAMEAAALHSGWTFTADSCQTGGAGRRRISLVHPRPFAAGV